MEQPKYTFYDHFLAARANTSTFQISEANSLQLGKQPYPNYNSSLANYESSFREVQDIPFADFLEKRRQVKGKIFTIDVMGTGGFTDEFFIDGQVAITQNEYRSFEKIYDDRLKDKHVIPGNVLTGKPWREARNFLEEKDNSQLQGYDLAILRPADAGWRSINNGSIYDDDDYMGCIEWLIAKRTIDLLSSEGGTAYIEYNVGSWLPIVKADNTLDLATGPILVHGQIVGLAARISKH